MLSSHSFSYFPLLVTVALVSCCIHAPAQPFPLCDLLSASLNSPSNQEPLSNITLPQGRNLTLFRQLSFAVPADLSSPSTFNLSTSDGTEDPLEKELSGPSLAFIFAGFPLLATAPSSVQYTELSFLHCIPEVGICEFVLATVCGPLLQQGSMVPSGSVDEDDEDDEDLLKDEVSLTYNKSTAEVLVQVVDYRDGLKSKVTFSLSTLNSSNENTTFFVGYITSGEAILTLAPTSPTSPPPGIEASTILPDHPHDAHSKNETHTNHIKVIVGVVVGTLAMGTLLGLIILVFFIKKRRGGRRPQVSSPTLTHGSIPLGVRSPFTHHHLESSVTPMMSTTPLPTIRSDAFQTSGTASWLKQPDPR